MLFLSSALGHPTISLILSELSPDIWKVRPFQPCNPIRMRSWLFLSGFCRAGMVEERNLPAGKGWKVCDHSSPTIRPVNPRPGNNSPPGVQPRPTIRMRSWLFLSGFCRAGMVEERNLPAAKGWKVCDHSSPATKTGIGFLGAGTPQNESVRLLCNE